MATAKNNRNQSESRSARRATGNRKVEPPRRAPRSERGLTHSPYFNGALYERMSQDLHLGGMSKRTHEGYLRAVRQLADYCKLSPDQITEDQLRAHFLHLKNQLGFASGSLRVAYSGIKFFYTRTCKRDWQTLAQMRIKDDKTLPEVLTIQQVHQIIDHCTTLRMAVYFWTVYSLGLRMNEGLHLQIGDIDSERMMVHIHRGKGAKDRYIPLPDSTLLALRRYWVTHRHPKLLFPADGRDHRGVSHARGSSDAEAPMSGCDEADHSGDQLRQESFYAHIEAQLCDSFAGRGCITASDPAVSRPQQSADDHDLSASDTYEGHRRSANHQ